MRSGRSSSERFVRGALTCAAAWALVSAARVAAGAAAAPPAATPPAAASAPNPAAPAPSAAPSAAASAAPEAWRPAVCPRCGFACDASWRFCPAGGWDRTILVGDEAEARRQAMTRASVGLTVTKKKGGLQDLMSAKDWHFVSRYISFSKFVGERKFWATAFPFGPPGTYVTSARVLDDAETVKIRTADNLEYAGRVVAIDSASGIGVLQADIPGSAPLPAASTDPKPPDGLHAICYPVGEDGETVHYLPVSLHFGEVSATGQSGTGLTSIENLVRTDHALPPLGCVGGPLVDRRGGLVGIIVGLMETGIVYAVPAATVAAVVPPLAAGHPPERPYFGLGLVAADARRRARFHATGTVDHPMIGFLVPGSPAEGGGVHPGDVLVAVAGQDVKSVSDAGARLLATKVGEAVGLSVKRGDEVVQVSVPPVVRPRRILLDPADEIQESLEANLVEVVTGPTSQQGLKVTDLVRGGRGERVDFKEGDVIVAIDGNSLRTLDTFDRIVRNANAELFKPPATGAAGGAAASDDARDTYRFTLDVRTVEGESVHRRYFNRYPEVLAPPVY